MHVHMKIIFKIAASCVWPSSKCLPRPLALCLLCQSWLNSLPGITSVATAPWSKTFKTFMWCYGWTIIMSHVWILAANGIHQKTKYYFPKRTFLALIIKCTYRSTIHKLQRQNKMIKKYLFLSQDFVCFLTKVICSWNWTLLFAV